MKYIHRIGSVERKSKSMVAFDFEAMALPFRSVSGVPTKMGISQEYRTARWGPPVMLDGL